ncbi:MAG: HypC/HybG/HupF family hydrogenase formation chaperone [Candidatus Thermoplasmatota archaeon]|nr:HypC/HybG/HupF family hydrogenase formation chaperone [Euryarchaeota archaeon]MBU4032256.1 HypC/HybG/HupF family hydrogenase formation chaperone [Candidatus Thermoplasmatota archaeon]MBU4071135.1 HypC/HybG/HupF family hydrogenase formation chaperone [Candidatus Thermoplasmatota archaeon]MBU4143706.1 HypC/HybG/HupF family hydrogenase formation chaperone [Candidatus Thermoplasmatota archaeon]MBU4591780.1 HypC/HybG/HupF family hydrogenase formation chaperone [Candidatus Thermoplasmatota archaeo
MCLAVPGKVIEITEDKAIIEYSEGVTNVANISLVEVKLGDYVLVHAGFAIRILSESDALETIALWNEMLEAGGLPDA